MFFRSSFSLLLSGAFGLLLLASCQPESAAPPTAKEPALSKETTVPMEPTPAKLSKPVPPPIVDNPNAVPSTENPMPPAEPPAPEKTAAVNLPPSKIDPATYQPKEGEILVHNVEELRGAIHDLKPGETLLLADGEYRDIGHINLKASGTEEAPITVRPLNPRQVTWTGEVQFILWNSYFTFEGLDLVEATTPPSNDKYESMFWSRDGAKGLRFTGLRFLRCQTEHREDGSARGVLIGLHGDRHRIDNCFLYDPMCSMLGIAGEKALHQKGITGESRIDHNLFRDASRWRATNNQGEAIFIGSGFSHLKDNTVGLILEYNVFDRANGDMHGEIITVKASDNTIRHNVFANAPGMWDQKNQGSYLSLRHTDRTQVYNNLFIDLGVGIWVMGNDHQIYNNFFINMDQMGVQFVAGNVKEIIPNKAVIMHDGKRFDLDEPGVWGELSKYGAAFRAPQGCLIAHNYFGGLGKFAVYARLSSKGTHPLRPENNRFVNNVVAAGPDYVPNHPMMRHETPELDTIQHNLYLVQDEVQLGEIGDDAILEDSIGFTSASPEELQLPKADSPARQAGQALSDDVLKVDFFGQPRPTDGAVDIGPVQFSEDLAKFEANLPPVPPMPGSLRGEPLQAAFKSFTKTVSTQDFLMLDAAFSAGPITNYTWNFGDGTTTTGPWNAVPHKWSKPGTYLVTLTVTDESGETSTFKQPITVTE